MGAIRWFLGLFRRRHCPRCQNRFRGRHVQHVAIGGKNFRYVCRACAEVPGRWEEMNKSTLFLLSALLLAPSLSRAGDLYLSFGPSLDGTIGERKSLMVAHEWRWGSRSLEFDSGMWTVPEGPAFYGGASIGVHVTTEDGFTMRVGFGPSMVSRVDDRLSSPFEFHIQARMGLELSGWSTGLQFDHLSNGGIVPPNPGLDLAAIYIAVPL